MASDLLSSGVVLVFGAMFLAVVFSVWHYRFVDRREIRAEERDERIRKQRERDAIHEYDVPTIAEDERDRP